MNELSIVTWNILHPDYTNIYEIDNKYLDYKHRLPLIVDTLLKYNADIICLQEADLTSIETDFIVLKDYNIIYQNHKNKHKKLQLWKENPNLKKPNTLICVILIKKNIDILDYQIGSRSLSVNLKINNKIIRLSNVHLEASNDLDLHMKHLHKLLSSNIICGDFNHCPNEIIYNYMTEGGHSSVYKNEYPKATRINNKYLILDYIYYKSMVLKKIEWPLDFIGLSPEFPSDHCSIHAVFELF